MLPKYIKVENFASYKNETINFDEWGDLSIVLGNNGVGKSSIIDMITVSIFNRTRGIDAKGSGMEDLIHQGADSFKIEYCFDMNNNNYLVIREKSKKSQTLQLFINGENYSGKLLETQQRLLDIIKMDYDTFMDTIIIGQGESASFMKKSPNERKKIITQILRLDKYNVLENFSKDEKKIIKSKLDINQVQMTNLFNSIKNKDSFNSEILDLKNQIEELTELINTKEMELENELIEKTKYDSLKKQQESILNRKNNIEINIKNIKLDLEKYFRFKDEIETVLLRKDETINKISITTKSLDDSTKKENDINLNINTLNIECNEYTKKINELKNKYIKLKDYNECDCQFCGQNISSNYKDQHLQDIKTHADKLKKEQLIKNNSINEFQNELIKIRQENKQFKDSLLQLTQLKTKIDQAEIKIENVKSKIFDLNERLDELQIEKNQLDDIEIIEMDFKIFNDNIIKTELNNLRQQLSNKKQRMGILENEIIKIEIDEKEYSKVKVKHDKLNEDMLIYEELQKAWSKNGIQAIIIDNILPQIEDEINKYLDILSNNEISIKFETQKEAKNGNKSETLDIIVSDSKGSRCYERYSGGQRTRIDFACHIGMSKFLAKRSGSNIDFFIIDEGIGTLDDAGKQNFIDTTKLLTTIFKKVMIISHIPDILESFEHKVSVTNDISNGSKVKVLC